MKITCVTLKHLVDFIYYRAVLSLCKMKKSMYITGFHHNNTGPEMIKTSVYLEKQCIVVGGKWKA